MPTLFVNEFFLSNATIDAITVSIQKLMLKIEDPGNRDKLVPTCKREAREYCARIAKIEEPELYRCDSMMAAIIEACSALGDSDLLFEVAQGISAFSPLDPILFAVAESLLSFPFRNVKPWYAFRCSESAKVSNRSL